MGFYLQKWLRKVKFDGSVLQNSYICGPPYLMKLDVLFDKGQYLEPEAVNTESTKEDTIHKGWGAS